MKTKQMNFVEEIKGYIPKKIQLDCYNLLNEFRVIRRAFWNKYGKSLPAFVIQFSTQLTNDSRASYFTFYFFFYWDMTKIRIVGYFNAIFVIRECWIISEITSGGWPSITGFSAISSAEVEIFECIRTDAPFRVLLWPWFITDHWTVPSVMRIDVPVHFFSPFWEILLREFQFETEGDVTVVMTTSLAPPLVAFLGHF